MAQDSSFDNFSFLRALNKSKTTRRPNRKPPPVEQPDPRATEQAAQTQPVARRTAIPSRNNLVCFQCGYRFQLSGHTPHTLCPKCRTKIQLNDFPIAKTWTENMALHRGTIHILPEGRVIDGELIARHIILEGAVEGGTVQALETLEVRKGARLNEASLQASNLLICAFAEVCLSLDATYRNVTVYGSLLVKKLHVTGSLILLEDSEFIGELHGREVYVEEGSNMHARVYIGEATA